MFRHILVALDGSPLAEQALPLAVSLSRRAGAKLGLGLVHLRDFRGPQADHDTARAERAYLDKTADRVRQLGDLAVTAAVFEGGEVAPALCDHARESGADLLVLTTHGRGPLSRFWLGSVADALLRQATIPLLIHRPDPNVTPHSGADRPIHRILVPLDGTESGKHALAPATELARRFKAELTLLQVVVPNLLFAPDGVAYLPPQMEEAALDAMTKQARADLDRISAQLTGAGLHVTTRVVVGPAAVTILDEAASAGLIALATHGRGRLARFFLGSVADKVVRSAPCPVLVVPNHPTEGGPS